MHAPPCAFCGAHGGTAGWKVASRTFRRRRSPCKTSRAAPVRRPRLVPVCVAQTEGPSKASAKASAGFGSSSSRRASRAAPSIVLRSQLQTTQAAL
eukprot:COSAG01_NODE_4218_length_5229_cov_16.645419_4_plen_96_part_00